MSKIKKFFGKFIGTKSFYKELLFVSMPVALQQFVSAIVNMLDSLMVSGFGGVDAQSGVAIANKYYSCFNMIMFMFAISCSVFIAQFYGANMKNKIKKVFGISLIITISFSVIAMVLGLTLKGGIMHIFTGGKDVNAVSYNYGISYLGIVVLSFIPQAITNSLTAAFRSIKKTKVPFISACCAAITNCGLNYVLINGKLGLPVLGTKGAAIATCCARLVELAILLIYFFVTKPCFYGNIKEIFSRDGELFKGVVKKSGPLVFAQLLTEAMGVFILFVYATLELGNSANVSAITVAQQINDVVVVFCGGLGTAASVLVGTRLGENKIEEARQNASWQIAYAIFFSIVAMTVMIVTRGLVAKLYHFNAEDTKLLKLVMLFQALSFPFMIYAINIIFISRAGGWTKAPIFITNLVYYAIKLPLIILFVWIIPGVFESSIKKFMSSIGLMPSFVIFIFIIDKFCEVIRAIVAVIIYKTVPWYKNITNIGKEEIEA